MFSREAKLPIELTIPIPSSGSNNDKNEDSDDGSSKIEETINRMKNIKSEIKKKVKGNIEKAQEKQKLHYDRRHNKSVGFRLNDKVLMRNSRDDDRKGGKLTKSWSGPYLVKECLPKGLYRLSDIKGKPLKRKVNASRLKKYLSNENKNLESSVVDGSGGSQVDMGTPLWNKVIHGEPLNDTKIHKAQNILQKQFPYILGLQDPVLKDGHFKSAATPCVQIHHTGSFHWICSTSEKDKVFVLDSMSMKVTESLQDQLLQIYGDHLNGKSILPVHVPSVQTQEGSSDCGLFAIAFAVEIAFHGVQNAISATFKQDHMRAHLEKCIAGEYFDPFPKTESPSERIYGKEVVMEISASLKKGKRKKKNTRTKTATKNIKLIISDDDEDAKDVDDNNSKRHIDVNDFKKYLHQNKSEILLCMEKTRPPHTCNPYAPYLVSQDLVELLCYDEALQVLLEFTLHDEDIKKLQSMSSLSIQNARFEKAFVIFFKRYISLIKLHKKKDL